MGVGEDKRNCGVFADKHMWVIWCQDQMVKRNISGGIYPLDKSSWVSNLSFKRVTSHKLTQWGD